MVEPPAITILRLGAKHHSWISSLAKDGVSQTSGPAARYAQALYSLADDQQALDSVVSQMDNLGQLIDESPELRRMMASPLVDIHQARQAAFAVLDSYGFGKLVRDFVGVIVSNRRLALLPTIIAAFAALVAAKRGIITATVTTAHPMSDVQEQQLRARLIESGYGQVKIVRLVDPNLLGGLVLRIGSRLYDTSLKSRLQRLQYAMKGAA
jgi:F-type H+-transporting ATPase subunit delta